MFRSGIAVGAGEVNLELTQQLSEIEEQLREKTEVLNRALEENTELRRRLAATGAGIDGYVLS